MSIILKGIDLPKGQSLMVFIANNGAVTCSGEDGVTTTKAIQIPKEHGRLIDIEKLKEEFAMKDCKECDSFKECDNKTFSKSEICEKFIWVPTILEAEE